MYHSTQLTHVSFSKFAMQILNELFILSIVFELKCGLLPWWHFCCLCSFTWNGYSHACIYCSHV